MTRLTVFLARFIGLFSVLVVAGLLVRGTGVVQAAVADAPMMFTYAIISLALGLAMVLGHNIWKGGLLPIVVTLVGWLIFAKGLMLLLLKPDAFAGVMQGMHYNENAYVYLAPSFVIGLYLTVAGFATSMPPPQG